MRIDLFKDRELLKEENRLLAYTEQRTFTLASSKEELENVCGDDSAFLDELLVTAASPRVYNSIFGNAYDSHFILEAMGLEKNTKENIIVVDLSNSLDYVLHRLTGCSVESVHKLNNYEAVSRHIMNYNFSALSNVKIKDLAALDLNIAEWIASLLISVSNNQLSDTEILNMLITKFYRAITIEAQKIRNYIMFYLRSTCNDTFIIKSRSLCSILATTDAEIDDVCTLFESGRDDVEYDLHILKFKKYEFYRGGAYNVLNWKH